MELGVAEVASGLHGAWRLEALSLCYLVASSKKKSTRHDQGTCRFSRNGSRGIIKPSIGQVTRGSEHLRHVAIPPQTQDHGTEN